MVSDAVYARVLSFFEFWPSKDVAIVALSLYLAASLAVLAMTVKTRAWYMLIATVVGLLEMGGFACRVNMFSKPQFGVYVAMQCLLIIPPSFIAIVLYVTLGKAVREIQDAHPGQYGVRPRLLTWGYLAVEMLSLTLQGIGAGTSVSNTQGPAKSGSSGKILLLIGLSLLVALMFSFILNGIYIYCAAVYGVRRSPAMRKLFWVLAASTLLLLTRNIFRLIEFSGGWDSAIAKKEVYYYTLDALLVLIILVMYSIFHFGIFFNAYRRETQVGSGQYPEAASSSSSSRKPEQRTEVEVV